nr:ParA family protein [uncultured Moraxella sp.]
MNKILIANQKGGCGKTSIATNLATALANLYTDEQQIFLADTDPQKSSLRWLKIRPKTLAPITALDWRDERNIGNLPENTDKNDWLIIDGQGAMGAEKLAQLVAECKIVLIPAIPSFFDVDSTKRFLKNLEEIKRVKKGKVAIYLVANRVRSQFLLNGEPTDKALQMFDKIGEIPLAWISERSIYQLLAEHGLSVFDKTQKPYREMQQQWQPILDVLIDDTQVLKEKIVKNSVWYE